MNPYVIKPTDVIESVTVQEFNVANINQIKAKDSDLRDSSKPITFAAQYGGTWITFMRSGGFSEQEAKEIEANYHTMYKVSLEWSTAKQEQASKQGYLDVAFGLRVRTPLLKQVMLGYSKIPREAQEEARTVGNATQQSYGLLNNRAAIEVYEQVIRSPYRLDIFPIMHIHDAQYFLIRDNVKPLHYLNHILPKAMSWQELPEIQHPVVSLGGELDLFYPTWAQAITLPPSASEEDLIKLCKLHYQKVTQ